MCPVKINGERAMEVGWQQIYRGVKSTGCLPHLLEDLLKSALRGAVSAVDGHRLPMLIPDDLHFDVPGAGAKLH